jgi:hypothetical protein
METTATTVPTVKIGGSLLRSVFYNHTEHALMDKKITVLEKGAPDLRADMNARFDIVNTRIDDVKADVRDVRADVRDVRTDVKDVRKDMNTQFQTFKADMNTQFQTFKADTNTRFTAIETRLDGIETTL